MGEKRVEFEVRTEYFAPTIRKMLTPTILTSLLTPSPKIISNSACLYGLDTYSNPFWIKYSMFYGKRLEAQGGNVEPLNYKHD